MSIYMWYSGATDITGSSLAKALGIEHGKEKPKKADIVIGWGAKTKEDVSLGAATALNHPNSIRNNRNKLAALEAMKVAKVNVAPFASNVDEIGKKKSEIMLPVIGRTRYHQGGKGFWNCPTMTHVREAVEAGAEYFQNLIEIKDEFRLHTFGNKVIYAVKKVKRTQEEMEVAYIRHEMDRQKTLAEKNGDTFDENTAEMFLRRQAKKFAQDGANMLIRSNRLGWKFAHIKTIDKALEEQAVAAIKALKLDFGAVDACIDADGKPWIIEVNTGPGLEETSFKAYVAVMKERIDTLSGKKTATSAKVIENAAKVAAKVSREDGGKLSSLREKAALMKQLVDNVKTDEEAAVFDAVFERAFGAK